MQWFNIGDLLRILMTKMNEPENKVIYGSFGVKMVYKNQNWSYE